jgi:hypothetical protein
MISALSMGIMRYDKRDKGGMTPFINSASSALTPLLVDTLENQEN